MTPLREFASRITSERKRLGLTQAQFAEACGVKAASQFLYEKGARTPNAEYLIKAKMIGASISFLFDGGSSQISATTVTYSRNKLTRIYKQTDDNCRDEYGRLLDLEYRIQKFNELLVSNSDETYLVAS